MGSKKNYVNEGPGTAMDVEIPGTRGLSAGLWVRLQNPAIRGRMSLLEPAIYIYIYIYIYTCKYDHLHIFV